MKAAVKEAWLKALRSGEYPQARNTLHRVSAYGGQTVGFCCLGVLCEIAVEENVIEKVIHNGRASYDDGFTAFLPGRVVEWSGLVEGMDTDQGTMFYLSDVSDLLEDYADKVQVFEGQVSVADLNDAGVPFSVIADVIERVF